MDLKHANVAKVYLLMHELGLTLEDLQPSNDKARTRPVKYADAEGRRWAGVGQRPRWLVAALKAGASLDQFKVRP